MHSKLIFLCTVFCLCSCAVSMLGSPSQSHTTTVPVFMWSNKHVQQSTTEILDTITTSNIERTLLTLGNFQKYDEDALGKALNSVLSPEAIVIFAEPQLRTDQMAKFSESFSGLNKLVSESQWSLTAPYATASSALLESALTKASSSFRNFIVIQDGESSLFDSLSKLSGVQSMKLSEAESFFESEEGKEQLKDGKTDLIVVTLASSAQLYQDDLSSLFRVHDNVVTRLSTYVATATSDDYVAIYTADTASPSEIQWSFGQQMHARAAEEEPSNHAAAAASRGPIFHVSESYPFEVTYFPYGRPEALVDAVMDDPNNSTNTTTNTTYPDRKINYFPGGVVETFLVVAILLAALFTGGCAIFSLQTPDRWEAPKYRREQM